MDEIFTCEMTKLKKNPSEMVVGAVLGCCVGLIVGDFVGRDVGDFVGRLVLLVGDLVGDAVGRLVGDLDVGALVLGDAEGTGVGAKVALVGNLVGNLVGAASTLSETRSIKSPNTATRVHVEDLIRVKLNRACDLAVILLSYSIYNSCLYALKTWVTPATPAADPSKGMPGWICQGDRRWTSQSKHLLNTRICHRRFMCPRVFALYQNLCKKLVRQASISKVETNTHDKRRANTGHKDGPPFK